MFSRVCARAERNAPWHTLYARLAAPSSAMGDSSTEYYDQAARDLFAQLGLDRLGGVRAGAHYNSLDPIYARESGAAIFVGNDTAARSREMLARAGVTHVVNCTDNIPNYHEAGAAPLAYLRFNVSYWARHIGPEHESVLAFTQPLFAFIDEAHSAGGSVLVHCLAGAHRAGTTGVLCLMHYRRMSHSDALAMARRLRPAINPIGGLPGLLQRYEAAAARRGAAGEAAGDEVGEVVGAGRKAVFEARVKELFAAETARGTQANAAAASALQQAQSEQQTGQ